MTWYKAPKTVLVIKKVRDASVIPPFIQLVRWLVSEKNMFVYVEAAVLEDSLLKKNSHFSYIKVNEHLLCLENVRLHRPSMCSG